MTAVKKDLYIEQGATFTLPFRWCYSDGNTPPGPGLPHDLTDAQVRMQFRKAVNTPPLLNATTENDKIVVGRDPENATTTDPTNGWITIRLSDEDTNLLTTKTMKYDLEVETSDGNVYRLIQGTVNVDPNITRED